MPMTMFWKCIHYTYLLWLLLCGVLTERKSALLHCSDTVVKKKNSKLSCPWRMLNILAFAVSKKSRIRYIPYTVVATALVVIVTLYVLCSITKTNLKKFRP